MRSTASKKRSQGVSSNRKVRSPRQKKLSVLGEGSYGCVVKPAIKCKENIKVNGKVSKLMTLDDAKKELGEYEFISKIPGYEEYTLPVPQLCTPKLSEHGTVLKNIFDQSKPGHCRNKRLLALHKSKIDNFEAGFSDKKDSFHEKMLGLPDRMIFTSLLFENGGLDLGKLLDPNKPPILKGQTLKKFLTAILKLIRGLHFFRENDILHKDIKLSNIVYKISTNEIKYIDFGRSTKLSTLISERNNNEHELDTKKLPNYNLLEYKRTENKKIWEWYKICQEHRTRATGMTREEINEKTARTIDSCSLATYLVYMFELLEMKKMIISKTIYEFQQIFEKYFIDDVKSRSDDLDGLYKSYEKLLMKHGLFDDSPQTTTNSDSDADLDLDLDFDSHLNSHSYSDSDSDSDS